MAKVRVDDLLRRNYATFDSGDKIVLRLSDIASLTRNKSYSDHNTVYSVFRVDPRFIQGKEEVDVNIHDASVVCFDDVCFRASFIK